MASLSSSLKFSNGQNAVTLTTVQCGSVKELLDKTDALHASGSDWVFRGHSDSNWPVTSTLSRYTKIPLHTFSDDLEQMLMHFMYKMRSLGQTPFQTLDRRSILEYARHYGIPTPVIDFSRSPFVAAYFASADVTWRHDSAPKKMAVFALNISSLAKGWQKLCGLKDEECGKFLYEQKDFFSSNYPSDVMKFIWFPASWNKRMQQQQGCFIYDGVDYAPSMIGGSFEDFVHRINEPIGPDGNKIATMFKYELSHKHIKDLMRVLESANVNGTNLLDYSGVASDVKKYIQLQ